MGKARDEVTLNEQVQRHKMSRPDILVKKKIYPKSSWNPGLFWGAAQIKGSSRIPLTNKQSHGRIHHKTDPLSSANAMNETVNCRQESSQIIVIVILLITIIIIIIMKERKVKLTLIK